MGRIPRETDRLESLTSLERQQRPIAIRNAPRPPRGHGNRLWPGDDGYLAAIPSWELGLAPTLPDGSVLVAVDALGCDSLGGTGDALDEQVEDCGPGGLRGLEGNVVENSNW